MTQKEVNAFAKSQGYSAAEYIGKWHEFDCYEPYSDAKKGEIEHNGLPFLILVDGDKIRMSTEEEAFKQIEETTD